AALLICPQRAGNGVQSTAQFVQGGPPITEAEIAVGLFEPMSGPDERAQLVQARVELRRIGAGIAQARTTHAAAWWFHPFQALFLRHPGFDDVEGVAHRAIVVGEPGITLLYGAKTNFFINDGAANADLLLGAEQAIIERGVAAENPTEANAGNAEAF